MKTVRVKKGDILSNAKKEVQSILDRLELIRFVDADLYLIDCKKRSHLNTDSRNTWTVFTLLFEH